MSRSQETAISASSICDELRNSLNALFVCSPHGEMVRIRTPFLYPDGDVIDLFCSVSTEGTVTVSDLGETTRWLRMQTIADKRTRRQDALIYDTAMNHNVEFYQGAIQARHHHGEDFAAVITRVAQAAVRVSDLSFTFRTRSVVSAVQDVTDFLEQLPVDFSAGERLPGRSGRPWTIDFRVRTPNKSSLVNVLTTGSRGAARPVTEHVLAAWYDLSHMKVGAEPLTFVSLFDDTVDVWSDSDFKLVEDLSAVARWSAPEEFERLLTVTA